MSIKEAEILKQAVTAGGTKLNSYDGNHGFYVSHGFEPVSWCKFDKNFAPPGWTEGRDAEEPIIFWKYTGNKATGVKTEVLKEEMTRFLNSVAGYTGETGYDDAMNDRDNTL